MTEADIQALLTPEIKAKILEKVKVSYEGDLLAANSIAQICFAAINFAVPKYRIMTKKHRDLRRQNFDNLEAYSRIIDDKADFDNKLIVDTQNEVVRELSLSEIVWDKSNTTYLEQGRRDVLMLYASLPHKLMGSIPITKNLTKEEFLQITQRGIELLNKEAANIQKYVSLVSMPMRAVSVAVVRVQDIIHAEYGAEEEDLLNFIKENRQDSEVEKAAMELQQKKLLLSPRPQAPNW